MPLLVEMKGRLNDVIIGGSFERFVHDLNVQAAQGKQFIMLQDPDDIPVGLNVKEILTVRPQSAEDAFFSDTISSEGSR
jgi:hypothetical protein